MLKNVFRNTFCTRKNTKPCQRAKGSRKKMGIEVKNMDIADLDGRYATWTGVSVGSAYLLWTQRIYFYKSKIWWGMQSVMFLWIYMTGDETEAREKSPYIPSR